MKAPEFNKLITPHEDDDEEVKVELVSESFFNENEVKRTHTQSCAHWAHSSKGEKERKMCECDFMRSKLSVL